MTLMVICPKCKNEFPCKLIQMNPTTFQTATLSSNSETCPYCKKMVTYSKKT